MVDFIPLVWEGVRYRTVALIHAVLIVFIGLRLQDVSIGDEMSASDGETIRTTAHPLSPRCIALFFVDAH